MLGYDQDMVPGDGSVWPGEDTDLRLAPAVAPSWHRAANDLEEIQTEFQLREQSISYPKSGTHLYKTATIDSTIAKAVRHAIFTNSEP